MIRTFTLAILVFFSFVHSNPLQKKFKSKTSNYFKILKEKLIIFTVFKVTFKELIMYLIFKNFNTRIKILSYNIFSRRNHAVLQVK